MYKIVHNCVLHDYVLICKSTLSVRACTHPVTSGPDVLRVVDSLLSLHVIAPLVITFWRGLWQLLGMYPAALPPWGLASFGAVLHCALALSRDVFMSVFNCRRYPEPARNFVKVLTRCYTYVFAVACIAHWRGVFDLLDTLVGFEPLRVALVAAVAFIVMACTRSARNTMAPPLVVVPDGPDFCFSFHLMFRTHVQHPLERHLHPDKHRLLYYVLSRVYTALFSFGCVNSFRGVWKALDQHTGLNPGTVVAFTSVSVVALAVMRALRNISAPPFVIVTDNHENYFQVPTMFHTSSSQTWLYILDCLFSVLVVHTLVVFVWRGAWCIFDIYLYPGASDWSAWGSLVIGYCITILAFSLQPCMMSVVQRLEGFWRVLVVDVYHLFSFFGTVNVWRGVWNLLNVYFLPNNPVASNWISHVLPFLLLVLLNSANSILVRGVYIDAEEEGGQCVEFPIYYLRLFFQLMRQHVLGKRPSGGSSGASHGAKGTLLDNNHHQNQSSPSPPSSRKSSKEQPLQPCLAHGLAHGMSHPHHHNLRVQLPQGPAYKDIPESPV
ncbi:hypothetical protein ONE63_004983 [Megalurothrips usitatus]|uniref:Uncharacterized protein n=1 Tax=Megalurothrips usitatus TaxID=439358 RepID=A0AAV7X3W9_9NEOP|nr:hypothetical protein ONE63_004983 [Megalurothrips usitatus]